ncbi:MAG: cyclic nucleotide-binding domain-containing protein [Nitrospinae bacterium]|nr:cyclic nucleotide-binding domain-containing protein [Nitrospinota bacterium]MBI3813579.1 cyclic nucleotide-binding domain-containing protein [Nitrospinota bacterium]
MIKTPIVERFADGQAIVTEGIVSTKAYLILSGQVRVLKKTGEKNVAIGILKEGDVFGEMGLFGKSPRTASVIAIGDVNVGVIDKNYFEELLDKTPSELKLLVNALVDRLKTTTDKLAKVAVQFEKVRKTIDALSVKTAEEEEKR